MNTTAPADFLRSEQTFYFWKGRVALYTLLEALQIGPGDEVIVPGFTCVVVPNAVLYRGAQPIYADIEPLTYNVSVETICPLITPRTRAIIIQNTFGLSPDLDPIVALAEQHDLHVIEDCAHGLGASYLGRPAGVNTHAAFFSTQWSKPISTGIGGIAYVSDLALAEAMHRLIGTLSRPSMIEQILLWLQLFLRPLADQTALHYPLITIYRFLTQRAGLKVGSSTGIELLGAQMPPDYRKAMSRLQHKRWQALLATLPQKIDARKRVAAYYDEVVRASGFHTPFQPSYADHGMLRYPIRVANKTDTLEYAAQQHIPIGDWFVSPLHPVQGDLSAWNYLSGSCLQAEIASQQLVNLFTDVPLPEDKLTDILKFMVPVY